MKISFIISVAMHLVFISLLVQDYGIKHNQNEIVYIVDLLNLPPDLEISRDITSTFKIEKAEAYIKENKQEPNSGFEKYLPESGKKPVIIGKKPQIATRDFSTSESFSPEQYMAEMRKKLGTSEKNYTARNSSSPEQLEPSPLSGTRNTSLASKIFPLSTNEYPTGLSVGFSENRLPAGNIIPLDYLENMKQTIQRKWKLPEEKNYSLTAHVSFRVKKDGTITEISIEQSSGAKAFDESALKAIREIKKIQPLPPTYQLDYLDVIVKFNMRGLD